MLTPGDRPLGPVDCESTQTKRGKENREEAQRERERGVWKDRKVDSQLIQQTLHKSELSSLLRRLGEVSFPQVIVEVEGCSLSQDNFKI